MRRAWRLILTGTLALLAGTATGAPAWGATAKVIEVTSPAEFPGEDRIVAEAPALIAEPGEANRVRIAPGPNATTVLIEDLGATVTVGVGCVSVDAHHARCNNEEAQRVVVNAGDLNDIVQATGQVSVDAHGGPGVDRLTGAAGFDMLSGGGGAGDVLTGLIGNDVLSDGDGVSGAAIDADALDGGTGRDTVSYARRTAGVRVDLSVALPGGQTAEGDALASIENLDGGRGADRITGSARRNALTGGPGNDVIDAGAGDDTVIAGKGNDRIFLGSGDDVADDSDQPAPTGRDQFSCGTGRDVVKATQDKDVDRLKRGCELLTAAENRADGNLSIDADAVTVRLSGLRRSGISVLVAVTCARSKSSPACVVSGELRSSGGGAALARPIARARVKAGRQGTLRMLLTRAGRRQVRRGKQVRLVIAERTSKRSPIELLERARAQAQVVIF